MTMALLLDVVVKGTVLLVVTAAIAFAFRRASASLRHLIWSMSVVGLLLLPLLSVVMPNWTVPGLENLARVRGRELPAPQTAPAAPRVSQNRHVSRRTVRHLRFHGTDRYTPRRPMCIRRRRR